MPTRRWIAVILGLLGAWVFWGGLSPILRQIGLGSTLQYELFQDPASLLRLVASGLIVIGALIAGLGRSFGALAAMAGTIGILILTVAMIVMGADVSLWQDEVVYSALFLVLTLGLFAVKRS